MRKRCRRKKLDPMTAITRRLPMRLDQTIDLGIAYRANLDAMLSGNGTEQSASTLICALDVALVLSQRGHSPEFEPAFNLALDALWRCFARAKELGKWGFDGKGQFDVRHAFDLHDIQLERVPQGAYADAVREVYRKVMK